MDVFDFAPEPEEDEIPRRNLRDLIFKLGAYYFFAGALCLIGYFVMIYMNPNTPLNPLPPAPVSQQPTATTQPTATSAAAETQAGDEDAAPTATDTAVPEEEATATPTATLIPYPTATDVVLNTAEPTITPQSSAFFVAQDGTPSYLPYAGGCSGVYVAGYVIDAEDNPLVLMTVRAEGELNGEPFSAEALSGSNTNYTESGWEIKLMDTAANTSGQFSVALYKQGSIEPVSEVVTFDTFASCTQNLVVINFVQEQ